jgi:hypothetical protein
MFTTQQREKILEAAREFALRDKMTVGLSEESDLGKSARSERDLAWARLTSSIERGERWGHRQYVALLDGKDRLTFPAAELIQSLTTDEGDFGPEDEFGSGPYDAPHLASMISCDDFERCVLAIQLYCATIGERLGDREPEHRLLDNKRLTKVAVDALNKLGEQEEFFDEEDEFPTGAYDAAGIAWQLEFTTGAYDAAGIAWQLEFTTGAYDAAGIAWQLEFTDCLDKCRAAVALYMASMGDLS